MPRPREFDEETALRKAMHAFWTKGFEATSIADLTEAMGVQRSTLYASFGDKNTVFDRAVELYMRDIAAERVRILRAAATVEQGLREFFEHHIRVATDRRWPAGCLFVNTALEIDSIGEETADRLASRSKIPEHAMRELLERGIESGEIGASTDARAVALMLVSVSYGIHVMARMHRDRRTLQSVADAAIASVL